MDNLIENVVANFWAIATVLLTAAVGAHFLWRNNFKIRRATACATFRSAVLEELGSIYPTAAVWPENIDKFLRLRFVALQTAVENFRPFVPWWGRWCFDRAWLLYVKGKDGVRGQSQNYWQYVPHSGTNEKGQHQEFSLTYREDFKRNVARLLSYARET